MAEWDDCMPSLSRRVRAEHHAVPARSRRLFWWPHGGAQTLIKSVGWNVGDGGWRMGCAGGLEAAATELV